MGIYPKASAEIMYHLDIKNEQFFTSFFHVRVVLYKIE